MKKQKSQRTTPQNKGTDVHPGTDIKPEPFISEEQIRLRAYQIYQTRGSASGHDLDDWLLAEIELKAAPWCASPQFEPVEETGSRAMRHYGDAGHERGACSTKPGQQPTA